MPYSNERRYYRGALLGTSEAGASRITHAALNALD